MGASTGIALAATGISFANEWVNTGEPNFRVGVAGLGVVLLLDGIEKFSIEGAVGLATIMLITILVTPFKGKSPVQTAASLAVAQKAPVSPGLVVTAPINDPFNTINPQVTAS